MSWQLIVSQGLHQGQTIPLTRRTFTIDRAPGCQLRASAASVSNQHCRLALRNDKLWVLEIPGPAGTFINGRRLDHRRELQPGDSLRVGPLVFVVNRIEQDTSIAPSGEETDEDAIAEMLLAMDREESDLSTGEIGAWFELDTRTD